jgi:acyl carrier protein
MEDFIITVAEALSVDPNEISPESEQGDLPEWDSVGHIELLMTLSNQYGKAISPSIIPELISIHDLFDFFHPQ